MSCVNGVAEYVTLFDGMLSSNPFVVYGFGQYFWWICLFVDPWLSAGVWSDFEQFAAVSRRSDWGADYSPALLLVVLKQYSETCDIQSIFLQWRACRCLTVIQSQHLRLQLTQCNEQPDCPSISTSKVTDDPV